MSNKSLKLTVAALMLSNVMVGLDSTIINTAIPAIVADLKGIQFMGWLVAIYLMGLSLSVPIWTKIAERISNKTALIYSIGLFVIGSILQGIAPNIIFFICARLIMGIGAGGMGSLPYIIVGFIISNIKDRTKSLGLLTGAFNSAAILGPLLGGVLIDTLSWHWVFFVNVPVGVVTLWMLFSFYHPKMPLSNKKFDIWGAFTLIGGLSLILLGIQLIGIANNLYVIGLLIAGVILTGFFFKVEQHVQANPIIPLELFKNRQFVGDCLLFAISWGAFIAVNTYLPTWAQGLLGASALLGGMTLIPNSIASITASQSVASLREKFSDHFLVFVGLLCMLISSLGMAILGIKTPLWILIIVAAFSGIGVGLIFVSLQLKVQLDVKTENLATATSTSYLVRILAQTLMSAIYGVIVDLQIGLGIAKHSDITMGMMSKLSDSASAKTLPANLLPIMRNIMHSGIWLVMVISSVMLVTAMIVNNIYLGKKD
ncbi:MAG: MFS transporter [Lactobacillus sp.]|nr:MFS transporter [Lactobacillus sp.]